VKEAEFNLSFKAKRNIRKKYQVKWKIAYTQDFALRKNKTLSENKLEILYTILS